MEAGRVRIAGWAVVGTLVVGPTVSAQDRPAPATPKLEFDVVSIRRNTTPMPTSSGTVQGLPAGQVQLLAVPVNIAVLRGYPSKLNPPIITGLPDWATSERYDIIAKGKPGATAAETQEMWRAMLADRLKLQVHYETRERPIYRVVGARSDGRLGPQLSRRSVDCPPFDPANRPAPPSADLMTAIRSPGPLPAAVQEELKTRCRTTFNFGNTLRIAGVPMADMFRMIGLDRPIVDDTHLEGFYDATLTYSRPSLNPPGPDDPPLIFTAVQDQLGLKFEPATREDEVVVVDHIERPTEN